MYRSLLVPLDGSVFAEHALPPALGIARRAGARLHLVHVHVAVAPVFADGVVAFDDTLDGRVREQEWVYLDAAVKRLSADPAVPVTSTLAEGPGPVADTLLEQARAAQADLIVMTTHGRGPLARFWLGSVADRLVRHTPTPILLVRPQEVAADLARDRVLQHILIPLDGSELAEQVLEHAVVLGNVMQADYLLVRVVDPLQTAGHDSAGFPISGLDPAGVKRLQENAAAYLERVAERLRAQGLRVHTRVVVSPQAAVAILEQASSPPIDLIALETHGRGGLARLLLGSVADKVLRGATMPVLVHRPLGKSEK